MSEKPSRPEAGGSFAPPEELIGRIEDDDLSPRRIGKHAPEMDEPAEPAERLVPPEVTDSGSHLRELMQRFKRRDGSGAPSRGTRQTGRTGSARTDRD